MSGPCPNCDDRKCMGCVMREWDHNCVEDCPFCCATVTVTPGAGGEDSQDFARMLREMYAAWNGTVNGEEGIHRLVRISPFDPKHRRTTSFAGVEVEGCPPPDEQIRSYVLHPYTRVTDSRLGREAEDAEAVLLGRLDLLREGQPWTQPLQMEPRPMSDEEVEETRRYVESLRDDNGRYPWDEGYEGPDGPES